MIQIMYIPAIFRPFGVDLFCLGKKFLVLNMVGRNLKVKYRRSILGLLWTIVAPFSMAMVYFVVFRMIFKIQTPYYLVYVVSGVFAWQFFSQTLMEGMESVVGNIGLLTKVSIPLQVFPYVGSVTNLITLVLASPVVYAAALISGVQLSWTMFLFFPLLFTLFLTAYAFSLIVAILFVFFRDLRHVMGIVMQIWFYGTPILYDVKMIPENLKWITYVNPVGAEFSAIRKTLIHGELPTTLELVSIALWSVGLLYVTATIIRRYRTGIVERL